jgi:hypothetical protein
MGTMSLCWSNFAKTYKEKELTFDISNGEALKTINNFNRGAFSSKDINEASFYVKTGLGSDAQALINKEVKAKFLSYSFPPLNYKMNPLDIISFAYFFKQLSFTAKFERRQKKSFKFNGKLV